MRTKHAYLLVLATAVTGCGKQTYAPAPPPSTFPLTASATAVQADGKATLVLTFTGAHGTVTMTTTRGHFVESGDTTAVIDSAAGHATLMTCDSRTISGCVGAVRVTAVDGMNASAQVMVSFSATENCTNGIDDNGDGKIDCADPECAAQSCALGAKGMGVCDTSGSCVCASGTAEICNDGVDNNCDGVVDCADTTCGGKACKLPSGLNGMCSGGACACPNMPEVCGDGIDNDCDGLVDCDDSDCQPQGNALGGVCDAHGHTCAPPQLAAGKSLCNVCGGNGGTPQAHETSCGDNHDNDCDGLIDCQDPDCANVSCSGTNKKCSPTTLQCTCATTVEDCSDHVDDNCDGLIDCADPQCANQACGGSGMTCGGGGAAATTCACSGNGGVAQTAETSCSDGRDNDCNGFVDCADPGCRPTGSDTFGLVCGAHGQRCDATGSCACPGNQLHESTCGDGQDNDCDGLVDCADPDCNGIVCSAVGGKLCSAGACTCPYGSGPETTCNDGIDNDCNGVADCDDTSCGGKQCGPSGTQLCYGTPPNATCKDTTSQYSLVLSAQRTVIPADGTSTVVVTATLTRDTTGNGSFAAQTSQPLTFASSDAQAPLSPTSATTDSNGKATTTLRSDAAGGTAHVTVSYTIPASTTVITATLDITMPPLGSVKQLDQQYAIMGARYSGYQETNLITFQLTDGASNPYPAGLAVSFTHASLGGSYIGNALVPCPSGGNCTQASGVTDGNGRVQVLLHAGTVANVVSVSAGASAGGVSAAGSASNIAIVGARASGAHISVDCTPKNIPALATQDCTNSQYFGKTITCTASMADRFNNVLGVGTLTTFASEAGAAGPPAMTPSYDPTSPPTSQLGLGRATDFVSVGGYALPVDVTALPATSPSAPKTSLPAEYQLTYVDACGNRTHNPRDGLSTIIASAVGEEGFVDGSNGCPADGVYQGPQAGGCGNGLGENFVDIGEPFVDANDNGVRDADESYLDVNNNGLYDPANGVWDASTVIWAETRVLYTGAATVGQTANGQEAFSRFFPSTIAAPQSPDPTATATFAIAATSGQAFGVYFVDGNFNPPAPDPLSKYAATKTAGNINVTLTQTPVVPDDVAMGFSQQYCPQPNRSSFDPGNTRAIVSAVAAGSATLDGLSGLTASDVGNYLTLSGGANAANDGVFQIVSVNSPTSLTISNAQAVAGDTVDWVDSQSDLTVCSSTCQQAPCHLVPHVAGFRYGSVGTVSVTAAPAAEAGESAQATCTSVGISAAINISGQTY